MNLVRQAIKSAIGLRFLMNTRSKRTPVFTDLSAEVLWTQADATEISGCLMSNSWSNPVHIVIKVRVSTRSGLLFLCSLPAASLGANDMIGANQQQQL